MLMAPSLQAPLANAPSQSTPHLAGDAAGKLGQPMIGCHLFVLCAACSCWWGSVLRLACKT